MPLHSSPLLEAPRAPRRAHRPRRTASSPPWPHSLAAPARLACRRPPLVPGRTPPINASASACAPPGQRSALRHLLPPMTARAAHGQRPRLRNAPAPWVRQRPLRPRLGAGPSHPRQAPSPRVPRLARPHDPAALSLPAAGEPLAAGLDPLEATRPALTVFRAPWHRPMHSRIKVSSLMRLSRSMSMMTRLSSA